MAEKEERTHVELGFADAAQPWTLTSKYFPSKIGGRPAWLRLTDLPTPEQLQCTKCQKPMIFLLQAYLPLDQWPRTFHRTIFVFLCITPECYAAPNDSSNFRVFRSQLPRRNDFYDYQPPVLNEKSGAEKVLSATDHHQPLCALCGCLAPKRCARCHTAYCSREHQTLDWKDGHKQRCKDSDSKIPAVTPVISKHLMAEFEIVTEPEPLPGDDYDESSERPLEERMRDYHAYVETLESKEEEGAVDDMNVERSSRNLPDLEAMSGRQTDKQFEKFNRRIAREPEQVIRYQRGGFPLWVSVEHVPDDREIPPCPCGSPRQFEFQVLPQLLNHLKLDRMEGGVDWGTVAIYTCSTSCQLADLSYSPEFVWKQDLSV